MIASHGLFGTSAVTALTVQSTVGVHASYVVAAPILEATLGCLVEDLPPAGVKLGMLGSKENVGVVVKLLQGLRAGGTRIPVVLDPVIRSTSGRELLSQAGLEVLRSELLPLVDWITPNLAELAALTGVEVNGAAEMETAVDCLLDGRGWLNVVATGGHLKTADDLIALSDGRREWQLAEKIVSRATHGTGCAYSTALMCGLVREREPLQATRLAKEYVAEAIRWAKPIGSGNGPMELLWPLRRS